MRLSVMSGLSSATCAIALVRALASEGDRVPSASRFRGGGLRRENAAMRPLQFVTQCMTIWNSERTAFQIGICDAVRHKSKRQGKVENRIRGNRNDLAPFLDDLADRPIKAINSRHIFSFSPDVCRRQKRMSQLGKRAGLYSRLRWILPETVFGSSSLKTTMRGYL